MDSNSKKHSPSFSKSKAPKSSGNQSRETSTSSSTRPPYSEELVNSNQNNSGDQPNSSSAHVPVSSFSGHDHDPQVNKEMSNNQHSNMHAAGILNEGGMQDWFDANRIITVFIDEVPTDFPTGPINFWDFFGNDAVLFHSSGEPVRVNECGCISEGLEDGATYFLVSTKTGTPSSISMTSTTTPSTCVQSNQITDFSDSNYENIGDQPSSSSVVPVSSFSGHHYDQQVNKEMSNNQPSNMQAEGILNEGTGGMVEDSITNTDPLITVFINKVPTDFPTGPISVRDFFGDDAVLFHSSGEPVRVNESGFILEGLEDGAMYILLSSISMTSTTTTSTCVQSTPIKDFFDSNYDNIGDQRSSSSVVPVSSFSGHHYEQQVNKEMSNNQPSNMQAAGILKEGTGAVQDSMDADAIITVFINDIPTNFPMGPINHRALFGDEKLLFHSSGHEVPVNEFGYTLEGLEHGALYFLI